MRNRAPGDELRCLDTNQLYIYLIISLFLIDWKRKDYIGKEKSANYHEKWGTAPLLNCYNYKIDRLPTFQEYCYPWRQLNLANIDSIAQWSHQIKLYLKLMTFLLILHYDSKHAEDSQFLANASGEFHTSVKTMRKCQRALLIDHKNQHFTHQTSFHRW